MPQNGWEGAPVLTTTLKALRLVGGLLQAGLPTMRQGLEVLVRGQGAKRRLMERFRAGDSHGQAGCILVASASFWEGFDVPGEALQLVVIDKLPFRRRMTLWSRRGRTASSRRGAALSGLRVARGRCGAAARSRPSDPA